MTHYALYCITFVLHAFVCVAIAAFVFPLWRRHRRFFFLAFGCSALLDLFVTFFDMLLLRSDISDADHALLSKALQVLHIISTVIFGSGLALLIRHFRRTETQSQSPGSNNGTPGV